jgi:hypothetical protein
MVFWDIFWPLFAALFIMEIVSHIVNFGFGLLWARNQRKKQQEHLESMKSAGIDLSKIPGFEDGDTPVHINIDPEAFGKMFTTTSGEDKETQEAGPGHGQYI